VANVQILFGAGKKSPTKPHEPNYTKCDSNLYHFNCDFALLDEGNLEALQTSKSQVNNRTYLKGGFKEKNNENV
jgi:hypothetical protein